MCVLAILSYNNRFEGWQVIYGIEVEPDHPILFANQKLLKQFDEASIPGTFLVDIFTFCESHRFQLLLLRSYSKVKYIPEWFPGASFKTFARTAREHGEILGDKPLMMVKDQLVCGYSTKFLPT